MVSGLHLGWRRWAPVFLAALFSLAMVLLPVATTATGAPGVLRKVPGASPAQTIERFLGLTAQAETAIRAALREGAAEPGWFYSGDVNRQVAAARDDLEQATQALDLSEVPPALRQMTGVATLLMLRSVLLYDLSQEPGVVLPNREQVQRDHISSWTLPDTPISLAALRRDGRGWPQACRQCSPGDFLFTSDTLAGVQQDFEQIFRDSPELRRRFGADLFVYWALAPGGAVPPKLFFRLPVAVRRQLLQPIAGQSWLQWLLLIPISLLALLGVLGLLWRLRQLHRRYDGHEGPLVHGIAVVAVGLALLLVLGWQWFAIDWINLIGAAQATTLLVSRLLQGLLQALLLYLLAETLGQLLVVRGMRLLLAPRMPALSQPVLRRQGAGQILTLCRVIGVFAAAVAVIQTGRDLGVTSMTLLALSSVPALAISLGTQQLIRDMADGFSLLLDGQIKTGDACTIGTSKSGEIKGVIRSLGMRSMRIQQADGSVLGIPNSQVAAAVVVNHRFRTGTHLNWVLPLHDLNPAAASERLAVIRAELVAVPQLLQARVALEPTDQSLNLMLSGCWDAALTPAEVAERREELLLRLMPILWAAPDTASAG